MYNLLKVFLIFIIVVLTHCSIESQNAQKEIGLAVISSLERLIPGNALFGKSTANIKAAKNEYEAFQLIISAGDKITLENVRIEITDLSGEIGRIGKENFELFRAENVHLRRSSPRAAYGPGLFPDPLLPFIDPVTGDSTQALQRIDLPGEQVFIGGEYSAYPIVLSPGQHCAIWVDIYIPSDAQAGTYQGEIRVRANQNISATIPVNLHVWDFKLPDVASHRTHLGHFNLVSKIWGIDRDSEEFHNATPRSIGIELEIGDESSSRRFETMVSLPVWRDKPGELK